MKRLLLTLLLLIPASTGAFKAEEVRYPPVRPGVALAFPRDHGSHPQFRIEWWYVTGHLRTHDGENLGFQVTFFRNRPPRQWDNPSAFNPRQLLVAHAALSDPGYGRILHGQKAARAGLGLAEVKQGNTHIWIDDWFLRREGKRLLARVSAEDFTLDLDFMPTQPLLLHGDAGFSRKDRDRAIASRYYSQPQLRVQGRVSRKGRSTEVQGVAWLDHEWSSTRGHPDMVGWDWTGINFDDGGALMAFRIRKKGGGILWAAATYRARDGRTTVFSPQQVSWTPKRHWRSPDTGTTYPVEWELKLPGLALRLRPIMDHQEMDARNSTNTVYWEGAVLAESAGRRVGVGYLELTGYWRAWRY
jgi:predicted secreted hydrolase